MNGSTASADSAVRDRDEVVSSRPAPGSSPASCPQCGARGRRVAAITLRSLLSEEANGRFQGSNRFFFCRTEACEIVYFDGQTGERFREPDLAVSVFQKSTDPSRLVCYCFEHSVEAVCDDAARNGVSSIADDIAGKCRRGLDRCEELNPQGSCCLGNVLRVAKQAMSEAGIAVETQDPSGGELPACCESSTCRGSIGGP